VDKNKMKMCIGIIVRDKMGEVLAALSEPKNYTIEPDVVEAITALRAIIFRSDLRFYTVVLESDGLQIVQTLKNDGPNKSKYGHFI
jgi:hypothetical protein